MMNRWWIFVLLLFVGIGSLNAQSRFYPKRPRSDAALYEGPVYGIKAGVNMPQLYYTNSYLGTLKHDLVINTSFSAFVELPLLRPVTISFELNYQGRGGAFTYKNPQQIKEVYALKANYVSFRVPVFLYMPYSDRVKPYLFASPDLSIALNGKIKLDHPDGGATDYSLPISPTNMKYTYLGALGGAGIRFNLPLTLITIVVKADAAINLGFLDTFSRFEHNGETNAVNANIYHINGRRLSRGLEAHLTLGFFFNKYDACSTFQR